MLLSAVAGGGAWGAQEPPGAVCVLRPPRVHCNAVGSSLWGVVHPSPVKAVGFTASAWEMSLREVLKI